MDGVVVQVAYLQSYDKMGWVKYACASGCTCPPGIIDSHNDDRNVSVTVVRSILVRGRSTPRHAVRACMHTCMVHAMMMASADLPRPGPQAGAAASGMHAHKRLQPASAPHACTYLRLHRR